MIKYIRRFTGVIRVLLNDGVVVADAVREQVLVGGQVAVHEAYGTPIDIEPDAHRSFVALRKI